MLKIIIEAGQVPDGATVTKVTGAKEYTLSSEIRFYGDESPNIKADKDVRFLINGDSVNIISAYKEVAWYADLEELASLFGYYLVEIEEK